MSRIGLIAFAGFAACLPARAIEDNRRPRTGNVAVESCLGSSCGLDEKGFVRDWLVCGPFPNYLKGDGHLGFETDFLDGESWVKPRAGDARKVPFEADLSALVTQIGGVNEWGFKETRVFDAAWRELHAEKGVVSLNRRFMPIDDHFVAYAACYVDSPRDLGCLLFCGSDDDSRVWVNSKEVGASATSQGAIPGYFKYSVTLKKGRNRILMKICDRDADCGFCVQFVAHRTYQPLTELSVTLDPGTEPLVLDRERAYECTPANIAKKRADLDRRKAAAVAEIAALEQESVALSNGVAAAERRLEAASAQLEARYAREHAAVAAKGAPSVDEPLAAGATRRELLLNGDWEASVDGKTWTDRFRLPARMPSTFYTSWYWPVKPSDPKNRFSKPVWANDVFAEKGAFPRYYYERRSRFRTTFDWDGEGAAVFRAEAIDLSVAAKAKAGLLRDMTDLAERSGLVYDVDGLFKELEARETAASTAIGEGVALLHPRFHDPYMFEETFVAYGRSERPVFFGAPDGEGTRHFFLICSTDHELHLHILARLAILAHGTDLMERLDAADSPEAVVAAIADCEAAYRS